jgi:acyl carrier protein
MNENTRARLAEIFQVVFDLPSDVDPTQVEQGSSGWDSLGHVTLVTALASEFDVEITAVDSLDITSFEAAAEILAELLDE